MISEFDIVRRYFTHRAHHSTLGVGDDAALVRARPGSDMVIATDLLVEDVHFFRGADPRMLGHKTLAVNLSDIAAMGATPRWALLALALPRVDERWLRAFSRGFMALARRFKVDLIGGDTTRGALAVCVEIIGEVPSGKALRRDGARVGDDIWVSGELGDAALALSALQRHIKLERGELARCAARLHRPQPRIDLGLALRGIATSAIDISDGLLADLGHVLKRSKVAAHLEFSAIPASKEVRRWRDTAIGKEVLLGGGDDYELCFTAPPRARRRIIAMMHRTGMNGSRIGTIERHASGWPNLVVFGADGTPMKIPRTGYEHFR